MPPKASSSKKKKISSKKAAATKKTRIRQPKSDISNILKSSLDSVDEGILVVDSKARIIFFNSNFVKLWSIPETLLKTKDDNVLLDFVLDQIIDAKKFLERVQQLYNSQSDEGFDQIEIKDGRVFRRFTKPHRHGKKIIGRVWSFRDVTDEVTHAKILIDWKNRYELVVASFGRVVYDYDIPSGAIIWSGNIRGVLGYKPHEMGNVEAWGELIHEADRSGAFKKLEEAQKNFNKYEVSYRFKTKSNGYIWIKDTGFFLPNEKNVAYRMLGEMEDITRQVQTEQEIRHLASFPLHNPEIVIEVKKDLTLNYANPSFYEAVRRLGLTDHYPFVTDEIREMVAITTPWKITVDVKVGSRIFNQKIYYLAEKELIRIYAYDMTERLEV